MAREEGTSLGRGPLGGRPHVPRPRVWGLELLPW